LYAQRYNYIYIQTEADQMFYVKLNNKILNSSEGGFIIIPKLQPGDYNLTIGFPKNIYPAQNFLINVNGQNQSFTIKKPNGQGWGLVNSYNKQIQYSQAAADAAPVVTVPTQNVPTVTNVEPQISNTQTSNAPFKNTIKKLSSKTTDTAFYASYLDESVGKTIGVYIAFPTDVEQPVISQNCTTSANDSTLQTVIGKINVIDGAFEKLSAIKDDIISSCFSTSQISALSKSFTTDEAKFKLFQLAYPHVFDKSQYFRLTDELTQSVYKQMLIKQINSN
jgi:hypothetical protein